MMKRLSTYLPLLVFPLLFAGTAPAQARTMEAGSLWMNSSFGSGVKLGSRVGGSNGFLMLNAGTEYLLSPELSVIADIDVGVAGTIPLRLHAGARYRLTGLGSPLSPFAQLQLTAGRVYNALGADLGLFGIRAGLGADYFITSRLAGGLVTHLDLNTTLAETRAFYGVWELLATASYAF